MSREDRSRFCAELDKNLETGCDVNARNQSVLGGNGNAADQSLRSCSTSINQHHAISFSNKFRTQKQMARRTPFAVLSAELAVGVLRLIGRGGIGSTK